MDWNSFVDRIASNEDVWQENLKLSPKVGTGDLHRLIPLSNGASFHVQRYKVFGTGELELVRGPFKRSSVFFYTCLSGIKRHSENWSGSTAVSKLSRVELREYTTTSIEIVRNQYVQSLALEIHPQTLSKICGLDRSDILELLHQASAALNRHKGALPQKGLDMELKMAANQAFRAATSFPDDLVYLRAKALEILSLHLRQLKVVIRGYANGKAHSIPDQVAVACDILRSEMATPPEALELARRVGMHHSQLVTAFRDRLGKTPFMYLREIRLNCARDLLATGQCNVTEASYHVGYGNISHFIKAFRDRFGMTPKSWVKSKIARLH